MSGFGRRLLERLPCTLRGPGMVLVTALVFLFAIRLLGASTDAARPFLRRLITNVVLGDSSALGLSWLVTYVLTTGSIVAALGVSLFDAGLFGPSELFLVIAGSRLGSAAIVVFVGLVDFVQEEAYQVREAVSLGTLTFLLTHSIYLPAAAVGYVTLPVLTGHLRIVGRPLEVGVGALSLFEPITTGIVARIGPLPAFVLAVVVLFGSLRLFDAVLDRFDEATVRDRLFGRFEDVWLSFAIGLVVTTVTTSVAVSLGVIVPLYNREYVGREEIVPYILGANIGTLFDTLLVAVVLQTSVGVATVLSLLGFVTAITLVALLAHRRYVSAIVAVDDLLLDNRRAFVAFAGSLVLGPLALLALPLAL